MRYRYASNDKKLLDQSSSQPERTGQRTDAPQNSLIFTRKRLQLTYNYTTPYLEI